MKFNSAIFAMAAIATVASATPRPEDPVTTPTPYHKKRDASALSYNITESTSPDAIAAFLSPGQPCDMVKRAAFAINDILKRHVESDATPCRPGSFCAEKRIDLGDIASSAIDGHDYVNAHEARIISKRTADDSNSPTALIDYCDDESTFCVRKRTTDPEVARQLRRCILCPNGPAHCLPSEKLECHRLAQLHWKGTHPKSLTAVPEHISTHVAAAPKRTPEHARPVWCGVPGGPCWRKRSEISDADSTKIADLQVRAPAPERARPLWCGVPGGPCWRKRSADDNNSDSPEPDNNLQVRAPARARPVWCGVPGGPCWRKRNANNDNDNGNSNLQARDPSPERARPVWCGVPGGPCWRKRSDVSEDEQAELIQDGGVANTLWDINDAVQAIKRDAAGQRADGDDDDGSFDLQTGHAAWGPDGPSANAMPYFDAIEDRVEAALYSIQQQQEE